MTASLADIAHLAGKRLVFRLVEPEDAPYIYRLRQDERYNEHLSPPPPDVAAQENWLKRYKSREQTLSELYYVMETGGERCGVVRIYDIQGDTFTWGSWILDERKPPKAALESALLIYDITFGKLGLRLARFDVRRDNERTLAFHRRFGAREIRADDQDVFFEFDRDDFAQRRDGLWSACDN